MKHLLALISLMLLLTSCKSEKEKKQDETSLILFNNSMEKIEKFNIYLSNEGQDSIRINIDSLKLVYNNQKDESSELGTKYAIKMETYSNSLIKIQKETEIEKARKIEYKKWWDSSRYGKLKKKYPYWTDEECNKVIEKKIWIGMSIQMLKYQRGNPSHANQSNYGSGIQWQWCWDDYKPSCFYAADDGIITSYN